MKSTFLRLGWLLANIFTLGYVARARRRKAARGVAEGIVSKEWQRISALRSFRRALHFANVWGAINKHPRARLLSRRARRAAAREAGKMAFRMERGLPEIESRSHSRRRRAAHIPTSMLMPVITGDGPTAQPAAAYTSTALPMAAAV